MTLAYFVLACVLVALAIDAKRDACTLVLAGGLVASIAVWLAGIWPPMPAVAVIDTVTCVAMSVIWSLHRSNRARVVGLIGMVKGMVTLVAWADHVANPAAWSLEYALFINAAFLVQVLVAGGFTDAVGHWLDHRLVRVFPVRWGLLRDGRL